MVDLSGKKAVVTGAGRGIGRGLALKLAEAGADLAILYRKKQEPAAELKGDIEKMGRSCHIYQCDVSNEEVVQQTFTQIKTGWARIDILGNNAGLASWGRGSSQGYGADWSIGPLALKCRPPDQVRTHTPSKSVVYP